MSTATPDLMSAGRPLDASAPRAARIAGIIGGVGLLAGVVGGFIEGWDAFFRAYLLNYAFVLSLALGGLFFVILQHAVRAGWSVGVRRQAEFVASALPILAILFVPLLIPVVMGMKSLFPWSNAEVVAHDALLQHKQPYLNVPFFIVRCVVYFCVWILLARYFVRRSIAQDESGDVNLTQSMQFVAPPALLLYGLTVTFFAFDLLMSLDPHWFSTIWGVYYFSGCMVGFFALLVVQLVFVQRADRLRGVITAEHYHDVGKLAFGFVIFWAYIAFSQYMLIWYANIPEETVWYHARQGSAWWVGVSLFLLFGHFFAPFLGLISRYPKRRPKLLLPAAIWLLVMHWLDLYYIVMPRPYGHADHAGVLHFVDFALLIGLGGVLVGLIIRPMGRHALLPVRDPRLPETLRFENI